MKPVLFQFRDIRFFSYTVFLDLALLVGLGVFYLLLRRYRLPRGESLDAALLGLLGGLVGARAHFVLAHFDYYAANPGEIVQFWRGGMAFEGGMLIGLTVCYAYARIRRVPIWDVLDPMAPAVALASAFGWTGNLLAGSAYGRPGRGFGSMFLPDIYGFIEYRFATQAAGIVLSLVIFGITLWLLHRRPWRGAAFASYLILAGAAHFGLGFTHGDATVLLGGLRAAQWLDLVGVLAGVALLIRTRSHALRPNISPEVEVG